MKKLKRVFSISLIGLFVGSSLGITNLAVADQETISGGKETFYQRDIWWGPILIQKQIGCAGAPTNCLTARIEVDD